MQQWSSSELQALTHIGWRCPHVGVPPQLRSRQRSLPSIYIRRRSRQGQPTVLLPPTRPEIYNKQLVGEHFRHRPQRLLPHQVSVPARVLRLDASPTAVHHHPPPSLQPASQFLPGLRILELRYHASPREEVHQDTRKAAFDLGIERVANIDEELAPVLPLELRQPEELSGDRDHGRVELPTVDLGGRGNAVRVEAEDQAGGGAGAEAEYGDGPASGGEEGREGGEDVEVGGGEGPEEEGDAVDVAGAVEEEEARAGEGVVGATRDVEDADVVVAGLEFGQDLHVLHGNALVLLLVLLWGLGEIRVGGRGGPGWECEWPALLGPDSQ